ncbi:MAG: 30S ribosomal protein S30 [Chitinophagaceae bacterium]|nr:MAG: 30S ribosomal protein S30 [Chitinophagaceae bacterium]
MDIIIQSLGFKAHAPLEELIREKLNALKSDDIVRANVTLFKGPAGNPENDYCEIRLEVPGNDHFVKKNGAHFETAFSECIDVLTAQIKKSKDKHVDRRQADASVIQDTIVAQEDEFNGDVDLEDVVKVSNS